MRYLISERRLANQIGFIKNRLKKYKTKYYETKEDKYMDKYIMLFIQIAFYRELLRESLINRKINLEKISNRIKKTLGVLP